MKILSLVPLLLLLGCSPKESPPASILTLWKDQKTISNPTEPDIRAAVAALDNSEIGPRLLLSLNGGATKVELSGTPRDGFGLDYREAANKRRSVYASKRTDLSAEAVTKVLVAARNGALDWKKLLEWKRLKRNSQLSATRNPVEQN